MADLLAALAIGFGILSLVFPAFVAKGIRRAEVQLRAIIRSQSYTHSDLELSPYRVRLTRLLGGWGLLTGLVVIWPSSPYLLAVMGGYAVVFFTGLGYAVLRSNIGQPESAPAH